MTDGLSAKPGKTLPIKTDWITLQVDGSPMQAYMAQPAQEGQYPTLVVLMEIFGVNRHIQSVTERLAAQGYIALAPNYYHRTTENMDLGYSDREVVIGRKHKEQTTREDLIKDLNTAIAFLQALPQALSQQSSGCIGFCFGGHVAFIAAELPNVAVAVAFYPGGVASVSPGGGPPTVSRAKNIRAEMLCLFGMDDPLIPLEDTQIIETALRQAGVPHEVIRYENTGHGFFCDQRKDYDPSAAEDSWERVLALLSQKLKKVVNT